MFSEHADFHFPYIFKTVFSIEHISRFFLPGSGLFAQSRPEQEHKVDFILAN